MVITKVWKGGLQMVSAKLAFAFVVGWFLGLPSAYALLIVLTVLDMASAMIAAAVTRTLDKQRSFEGVLNKIQMWVLVIACDAVGHYEAGRMFGIVIPAGPGAALLFCGHEFVSLVANVRRGGLKLPFGLSSAFDALEAKTLEKLERKQEAPTS